MSFPPPPPGSAGLCSPAGPCCRATICRVPQDPCALSWGARPWDLWILHWQANYQDLSELLSWSVQGLAPGHQSQLHKYLCSKSATTETFPFLHAEKLHWVPVVCEQPLPAASSEEAATAQQHTWERRMSSRRAARGAQREPRLSVLAFPPQRCRHSDPQPQRKANNSGEGRAVGRSY